MKISDIFNSGKIASTKRKGKVGSSGEVEFGSLMDDADEASDVNGTQGTGGILGNNLVLSQALYSNMEVARKNIHRASRLLDNLDEIKYQILDGDLSYDALVRLKEELKYAPQETDDAKLHEIIKEIELRAEVEIAKLERINNLS